jgi:hypothetical protein
LRGDSVKLSDTPVDFPSSHEPFITKSRQLGLYVSGLNGCL